MVNQRIQSWWCFLTCNIVGAKSDSLCEVIEFSSKVVCVFVQCVCQASVMLQHIRLDESNTWPMSVFHGLRKHAFGSNSLRVGEKR